MTTQTARKGEPGHIREDRERTERTPTGRERRMEQRIRLLRQRRDLAYVEIGGKWSQSIWGWLEGLYHERYGDHAAKGRGRFASPTKAGPGRRANPIVSAWRKVATAIRPRYT